MCYREVQCRRHACGHEEPFGESKIDCQSDRCRYSSAHPRGCATCSSTCIQQLGMAQRVVTQRRESFCYHCNKQNTS
ncbi:hypothetical protein F5I97DRAFT_143859 [Phlebopus sp. FC_14]|nr:hypothetical protein F5I97DRAFT_143859 [Phlebopus sp. FC_14]